MVLAAVVNLRKGLVCFGLDDFGEPIVAFFERLRKYANVSHYSHEVGIAFPAGDDMPMYVAGDSGSGGSAEVHSNVETIGTIGFSNPAGALCHELIDFEEFFVSEKGEIVCMAEWGDHKMAVRVRECVHDYERGFATVED